MARIVDRKDGDTVYHSAVLLDGALGAEELQDLRDHVRTSHPPGSAAFFHRLEQAAGRVLRPRKPERPAKLLKQPS